MKLLLCSVLFLIGAYTAHADAAAYGGRHEVKADNGTLTARHVHNWDSPKVQTLFLDLTHHEKFFTAANDFAHVELRDKSGKILFRSPSPALRNLWISPDSQFVVGLSDIMLYNPYQVVVWRRDGTVLHREHISSNVAKLTVEQRQEFSKRFPKAEQSLEPRYFKHGDSMYLDYALLGIPNEIGDDAWHFLDPLRVRHPYSDDFGQSVTNWIRWFDSDNPAIAMTRQGNEWTLSVRSPKGREVIIPMKK